MDSERLPHGTTLDSDDGRLARIRDRHHHLHAELTWDAGGTAADGGTAGHRTQSAADAAGVLIAASFPPCPPRTEPGGAVVVLGLAESSIDHPVLGRAHRIAVAEADGALRPVAVCGAVDWAHPTHIPPVDQPGALPSGAGTAILNLIALAAARASVARLRYAGPYPTAALWASLRSCFTPLGGATEADFTAGAIERAARGDRTEIAVDFAPAPFERIAVSPRVFVQCRDGLERAVIDDDAYDRGGALRRLCARDGGWSAEVWFGDAPWAEVARFAADGELTAGPHPLPALDSGVVGRELPIALRAALAELVAELVAAPLGDAARQSLVETPVVWGDAGARAARDRGDHLIVHAMLWERLAPHGLGRVALGLAEALAPLIAMRAQRALAALAARDSGMLRPC